MSTKKQQFYGEIKLNFFMRDPKCTGPRLVYLSTYIGGIHYSLSTKVKVYACQWNYKKQIAVISNVQSKQDNHNNKITNDQLSKLRRYFSEFIEYICNNDVDDIGETLRLFIYRDMAKKKKLDLKQIIAEALEYYHKYVKPSIKESTKRQNESLLSEFNRFVDTLLEKDKTMQIFSQKGMNRYKKYLIDKMERSKTDGKKRNFGVGQLNRCGAIIALLINRVLVEKEDDINPVVWNKVDDPRREDQIGHIPLLDNEVAAIENCSGLTDVEEEYRNLFLLQLECGQRVSDMAKILIGKYNVQQGKKYQYIVLSTIKENIKAYVPMTPRMTMLMERVKAHKLVDPVEFEEKTKGKGNGTYNEAIRRIAKKADLNREIVKINASQTEVRKPLYETITSHDARCTFITNMIKKGVSPERLCKMTGHASDEMIKRVYAQLSDADEINRIESDLYCDMDDDGPNIVQTTSSNRLKESVAVVNEQHKDFALSSVINNELDYNPLEQFGNKDYIDGLKAAIELADKRFKSLLNMSDDEVKREHEKHYLTPYNKIYSITDSLRIKNKEEIIQLWQVFAQKYDKLEKEKTNRDTDFGRVFTLHVLINYCKDKGIGNDAVKFLQNISKKIFEENLSANLGIIIASNFILLIPIARILLIATAAWRYVIYKRPYIDHSLPTNMQQHVNRIPDWNLVYKELKNMSNLRLQAIIQKTDCNYDIRTILYKSIISRDATSFANTMRSHEHEAYGLVAIAYELNYINKISKLISYFLALNSQCAILDFTDSIDSIIDYMMKEWPFYEEESFTSVALNDSCDIWDRIMSTLDFILAETEILKNSASPSEKKIFIRILNLINEYPELKAQLDNFKLRQNTLSENISPDTNIALTGDTETNEPNDNDIELLIPNYISFSSKNIDLDRLVDLLTKEDELNNYFSFVSLLESNSNNADVGKCLKHFLSAATTVLSFKLKWNGKGAVSLKFLIRLLVNRNTNATEKNVIDEKRKDGISKKYVSTGQGQGRIWPSVCKVFNYDKADSIMTARLGDSETARSENLKQLRTIAKIYFSCKK